MESTRFDTLAREVGLSVTRRRALGALLGGLAASLLSASADAQRRGRQSKQRRPARGRERDRRGARRRQNLSNGTEGETACYPGSPCIVAPNANLAKCDLSNSSVLQDAVCSSCNLGGVNLTRASVTNANLKNSNLGKACLVDADLTGANLASANLTDAILCRTRMPNGTLNNSGCSKPTDCCQTCNVLPGESCAGAETTCCGGAVCRDGVCTCPVGQVLCNGVCRNLQTDPANCGSCGDRCGQGETCRNGQCGIACGTAFCDPASAAPNCCRSTCTNLLTDPANCGSCGNRCAQGETCQAGQCGIACGTAFCDAASATPDCCGSTCTNLRTDPANCGACGEGCQQSETCRASQCGIACGSEFCDPASATPDCCGSTCTNLLADPANCGACGEACQESETCDAGVCNCAGCLTSGICVAGNTWSVCGADGTACTSCADGEVCNAGQGCATCAAQGGTSWCDRDDATRCNGGNCSCLTRVGDQGGFCAASISCHVDGGPPICTTDADCAGLNPPGEQRCVIAGDCQDCNGGLACARPCAS